MIKHYPELAQQSDEWFKARCGILTASEMKNIITPETLQPSKKKKEGEEIDFLWDLLSQRITGYVEPDFQTFDMRRGHDDELDAKRYYQDNFALVKDMGLITNDKWGFTLGFSPDGMVEGGGFIESKGRKQKFQVETIINGAMPNDFRIQVQTGLMVSEEPWCDFISFCNGFNMLPIRIYPDADIQKAILAAAEIFHERMNKRHAEYQDILESKKYKIIPVDRRPEESEMHL